MYSDLAYVALLFVLFVVPRLLQRYRLPSALTSLALGVLATRLELFQHDQTITLLAGFGIVALFLFAGLDVDVDELRPDLPVLLQHLATWALLLAVVALAAVWALHLPIRAGALTALALVTPSTGFILDSLNGFGLSPEEKRWVKAKAISSELLALGVMFVALQSATLQQLGLSVAALVVLIALLPPFFRWFAARIAPYAPRSEFAFLLMVAVVSAAATRRLGVYYLVGAFVVGLAARRFRERLPAMSSERMLGAVEAFASFFVPFYFFKAGMDIEHAALQWRGLALGAGLFGVMTALRLGKVALHRRLALGEPPARSLKVGLALLPTLVFTLVLTAIMRERYGIPDWLVGTLVAYTVLTTLLPGLLLHLPPAPYESPHLEPLPEPPEAGAGG